MIKFVQTSRMQKIILGLITVMTVALGSYAIVQAYAGTVYGRASWFGYFTNIEEHWGGVVVLPELAPGQAIPDYVNTVSELVSLLKTANDSGDAQRTTGSAFIVYTMLGLDGGNHDRNVSDANWTELTARLNARESAGRINWTGNVDAQINSYYNNARDDDFFHTNPKNESGITISDDSGNVVYQILRRCANPMGDKTPGLPLANVWNVSTSSSSDRSKAKPGDTITWTHRVTNDGPNATDKKVNYNYQNSGGLGGGSGPIGYLRDPTNKGLFAQDNTTHLVTQNDVGNTLCRSTSASPSAWNDSGWVRSTPACVDVPYDYTLTPSVTTDHSGVIEPSTSLIVTPTVDNTGPTKSQSTQWQVTQIVVAPGQAVPNAAGGTSPAAITPCGTYFRALPNATCTTINSGRSVFDTNGNVLSGNPLTVSPVVVGDLAVGTKICFAFSVQPSSDSSDAWRHSAPTCLIIGKRPKLQILGGDLISGGSVNTSTTNKNIGGTSYTFGSWIEYGIFAVRTITGAGSGSAYAGPGLANATNCNVSLLSFTNAGSSTCSSTTVIGNYSNASSMPDVASSFSTAGAQTIGANDLADQTKTGIFTSGNVILTGGTIQKGRWLVINAPTADITIDGDIVYFPGVMQSISDIPQVVIIAKNINITAKVTQVDAWLIAKGSLNTCSDVVGNLSATLCSQPLVVNGPVMAGKMVLRRTAGSGTGATSGDPAEVFNLRPDAYLWASARATGSGRIQTVYTTELPPRL